MADRYWVGGTASWDATAGTKWSATSGGAGGASVPTSADDVFFNAASGDVTCTIVTSRSARNLNFTGFTGTLAGSSSSGVGINGNLTVSSGMTWTQSGSMTFVGTGTQTITTNGKQLTCQININGASSSTQLGDALNITRSLIVTQGTFSTNNYNVTSAPLESDNSNTRTINLGSSTVSLSGNDAVVFTTSTNLTFNAGTSSINLTGSGGNIRCAGQTFYDVSFTNTTAGTRSLLVGSNTFNNLSITASATGLSQLSFSADQTVNGTFTCAGSSANQRAFVRSNTIGTTRTITANAIVADDCDFRDITIAGSAAGSSPTRAGDCGGNSGITFPSPKTVYWNLAGSNNWAATGWATSSGGTPTVNNLPLAQDTAVFDDAGAATNVSVSSLSAFNIGSVDASARTTSLTLTYTASAAFYGNFTLGSGVTVSGTSTQTFSGRGTQTFTSAGKTITFPIVVNTPSGTFQLGDAYNSSNILTLTQGTLSAGTYNVTCTTFNSTNTNVRTINMGSGLWTITGTGALWITNITTNLTFNKETANILLSNNTTTARTFNSVGLSFNKLTIGGNTSTSITTVGANSFSELDSTKTVAHTVSLNASGGTIDTWSITGSAGNVVTVNSSASGTQRTFTLTNVTSGIDYLAVKDIGITDPNKFYVGANSTNNGNNTNVIFTAAPAPSASNSNFFLMFG